MLLKRNINRISINYDTFILPATKSNTNINGGRPSCGLGLIYSKSISKYVKHLACPGSNRVQAIKVSTPADIFVFINVYLPTDPRVNNFDDTTLIQSLQDIQYILNQCGPDFKITVLGDLNSDLNRNTQFVNTVKNFMTSNNLVSLWDTFQCDFTYSQQQVRNGRSNVYYSALDHFFVNDNCAQVTENATVLHFGENLSNHEPIWMKSHSISSYDFMEGERQIPTNKPAWNKVNDEHINSYTTDLSEMLQNIIIPIEAISCNNLKCSCRDHITCIDQYVVEVTSAISDAVARNIPMTNHQMREGLLVGWNDMVKPYQTEAKFWHSVWLSYGKPQNNQVHEAMKFSRNQYHFAVRRAKNHEAAIRKDKFLNQCLNNKSNCIFKELKNQRKVNDKPNNIDGITGDHNIADKFKDTYEALYNVHNDKSEVTHILDDIDANIQATDLEEVHKITPALIKSLIDKMKSGKNDVEFDFRSDALKHGGHLLAAHISDIFRTFLTHGHITDFLLKCSLIPIPKDPSVSISDSSNYRAIAMSALLMKLYDMTMLELVQPQQHVSHFQYGFMKNISTTFCTWTVSESINYFSNRGGPVYACLLDLTKAFDRVKLSKLFHKLKDKVPMIHLRLLIYSYIKQQCCVRWGSKESDSFSISNGVRQGAASSPVLFSLYIDSLFQILEDSGYGCSIDHIYYGVCAYADDIVLLSPSRRGLQLMLNIAQDFCKEHGINISTNIDLSKSKTKCMAFNVPDEPVKISLNGVDIPWVSSYKHLGHLLHISEDWHHDLLLKRGAFIGGFHELQQELGVQHPDVMLKLVNTYNTCFYGSSLWDLNCESATKLWASWHRMLKCIYKLPFGTHRFIVNELCTIPHLRSMLCNRFLKFQNKLENCDKPQVQHLQKIQKYDLRSTYGRNCYNIKNGASHDDFVAIPRGEEWRVPLVHDIIDSNINGFIDEELKVILEYICVH